MKTNLDIEFSHFKGKNKQDYQKGQALILVAVAFVVLLAFVGLSADVGQLFIYMGHLRRSIDAASLAAASQYREGWGIAEMTGAAAQVMNLNGIDPNQYALTVETCGTNPSDDQLCTDPPRKLVRVRGELDVPMAFLRLIGIQTMPIESEAIAEAASLDVVLVIDISESMAWDAPVGNPMRDPSVCNAADPGGCEPFEDVKEAAASFIDRILNKSPDQEEDRLQIVTFANGYDTNPDLGTHYRIGEWTSSNETARNVIENLKVFEPNNCFDPKTDWNSVSQFWGPCLDYEEDEENETYRGIACLSCTNYNDEWPATSPPIPPEDWAGDWSYLPTTNIGGGLYLAGQMFAMEPIREEALWVVVILTDGMANTTFMESGDNIQDFTTYPVGFCPTESNPTFPLCQDKDVSTRHSGTSALYDADDYARDMADYVGCYPINPASDCGEINGQGAVIFAIGLGNGVLDNGCVYGTCEAASRPYGASLLRYIANVGYDGDPDPNQDPCRNVSDYTAWCGNYYYSPTGSDLDRVFEDIAARIFTRLTH